MIPMAASFIAPTVDGAGFLAEFQPLGVQQEWASTYPNGIPAAYKMHYSSSAAVVPDEYWEDNLPGSFFKVPQHGTVPRAIFSTNNGARDPRWLDEDDILPPRRLRLWSKDEIQARCNSTRKVHWKHMKGMKQPKIWQDLYEYYDAYDINIHGAQNLWNVLCTLFDENQIIASDVKSQASYDIGTWADEWLNQHGNKTKLVSWSEGSGGSIESLLSEENHHSLGHLSDDHRLILCHALKCRRASLVSPWFNKTRTEPNDVISAVKNGNFENWQGEFD
jgi:hypothetical protein